MKTFLLKLFKPALLIFFTMGSMVIGCRQSQNKREDEMAMRNIIRQMTEGFNKYDAKTATQIFTADADLPVHGDKYTGAEMTPTCIATSIIVS